ncbi:MAG: DNA recombination protein RmuC [Thermoanaerobaculia bacterium]
MNENSLLIILAGAAFGIVLGWLGKGLATANSLATANDQLRELDRQLAVAGERVNRSDQLIEEQKLFIESAKKDLEATFQSLASKALKGTSEQFLTLAEQKFAASQVQAVADLEERKTAIATLLSPFREILKNLDTKTTAIEKERTRAYSRIDEQIRALAEATSGLQERTISLTTALKGGTHVRGRWGEIALKNIAELAGMTEHCDFEEQPTIGDGKRPDMTVKLPGGRHIVIDAKAPLSAFLEANDAATEADRKAALQRHVKALKTHIKDLSGRNYESTLESSVDLVVMFLPGDPFLSAAASIDPDLQVEALRSKVLIATPTTLIALLRTVAIYWQQRSLAENAEEIAKTATLLYERAAKFEEELSRVGKGLGIAVDAYNRAVGSFEKRLIPMGNRLEQMKVTAQSKRELQTPEPVEGMPRLPRSKG